MADPFHPLPHRQRLDHPTALPIQTARSSVIGSLSMAAPQYAAGSEGRHRSPGRRSRSPASYGPGEASGACLVPDRVDARAAFNGATEAWNRLNCVHSARRVTPWAVRQSMRGRSGCRTSGSAPSGAAQACRPSTQCPPGTRCPPRAARAHTARPSADRRACGRLRAPQWGSGWTISLDLSLRAGNGNHNAKQRSFMEFCGRICGISARPCVDARRCLEKPLR
jgi:hypothetical protein